ncbi:hypothetical protein [Pedobacter metabolipauper]|uniref:ABC-2 family transporter n=1 Tax=Pedobacter metabolipauper TaxID=425513 RepID=A0A4R6SXH5_9SPHI|nr:hypothetical protein [Pedobacter metabolipauper]TDQ09873.1 hypothetical protein ATK78_2032 [Pedobacter metabolipauper]
MNNIFNIGRFGLLLKRQWVEFGKIYLISLFVVAGLLVAFYAFNIPSNENLPMFDNGRLRLQFRLPLFIILGFLFISIVSSGYYAVLGQKARSIIELMTPASTFEKFLAGVLFTGVLTIFCFILIFSVTDIMFMNYMEKTLTFPHFNDPVMGTFKSASIVSFYTEISKDNVFPYFYAVPFLVTSVFLLGSIYFNTFHYIKTAISVMVFISVLSYFTYKVGSWIHELYPVTGGGYHASKNNALTYILIGSILITLIFWITTYFRLKEKEA